MTAKDWIQLTASAVAILLFVLAVGKFAFAPHIKQALGEAIDEKVGPQLAELPTLTSAVDRLTDALDRHGDDIARIEKVGGEAMKRVEEKVTETSTRVDDLEARVGQGETRLAVLEERTTPAPKPRRRARGNA